MRLFRKSKDSTNQKNSVLFVCVENAGRSQMAEGFFRKYSPEGYEPVSAGTRPVSSINPLAIEVMKEVGIDISKQKSKILTEDMIRKSTLQVNMGCIEKESCPTLFIHNVIDWNIEDPKGKSIEKVREIRDVIESRVKELTNLLTPNQKKFLAEVIGTFIVVVFATGSVVLDSKMHGVLGISFVAFAPFVGIAIAVYMFGKISMAHFNPAVTIGFLITKHITKIQLVYYLCAEIIGALLGSLFVKYAIGFNANLGANAPNFIFPIPIIFGIEVLASALLMAVIFMVVYTKGLRGFSGIAIGGIVGLDIFFLAFISGASMNPARSLAPALLSGVLGNLWLYWSATFVGTSIVAFIIKGKFIKNTSL